MENSNSLLKEMPYAADKVNSQVTSIKSQWGIVEDLTAKRKRRLESALKLHQYFADVREIEADMNEVEAPISSTDFGHDVDSIKALIKKHKALEEDLQKIAVAIDVVEKQCLKVLDEEDRNMEEVVREKSNLKSHFEGINQKFVNRQNKLLGNLALDDFITLSLPLKNGLVITFSLNCLSHLNNQCVKSLCINIFE